MHGLRHSEDRCGGKHWAARRFGRFGEGPRWGGHGEGRGGGRGDWFRVGRMLAQGDLKLLALALIAEQPRHGYELIKLIEDKTRGAYSPSPGVVYPTLTFLEEAGYVTAESEGAKKRYTITDEGRAYLEKNRDESHEEESVPRLVTAALDNLREVAVKRLEVSEDAEVKIVEILARAAQEIRGA